jgi:membrane protein implicated in regulation of membrane protease activity
MSAEEKRICAVLVFLIALAAAVLWIVLSNGESRRQDRLQQRIAECHGKGGIVMEDGAGWTYCIIQGAQLRLNSH